MAIASIVGLLLGLVVLAGFGESANAASTLAFVSTGSMAVARTGHTATRLLDGRVLVTGGHDTGPT